MKPELRAITNTTELRQRGNDVLCHAVREILLFRITAHVGEWQDSNGGFVGKGKGGLSQSGGTVALANCFAPSDAVNAHRFGDIL